MDFIAKLIISGASYGFIFTLALSYGHRNLSESASNILTAILVIYGAVFSFTIVTWPEQTKCSAVSSGDIYKYIGYWALWNLGFIVGIVLALPLHKIMESRSKGDRQ